MNNKKLPSFKYKGLVFHNVHDNVFHSETFGDKLVYELKNNEYHLIKDERLSEVISLKECISNNSQSYFNDDNNWK